MEMKKIPKAIPKRSILAVMENVEILPTDSPLLLFPPVKKAPKPRARRSYTPKAPKAEKLAKTSMLGITSTNLFNIFVDENSRNGQSSGEPAAKKPKAEINADTISPYFSAQNSKDELMQPGTEEPLAQINGPPSMNNVTTPTRLVVEPNFDLSFLNI